VSRSATTCQRIEFEVWTPWNDAKPSPVLFCQDDHECSRADQSFDIFFGQKGTNGSNAVSSLLADLQAEPPQPKTHDLPLKSAPKPE
jgi:hypothetical protein